MNNVSEAAAGRPSTADSAANGRSTFIGAPVNISCAAFGNRFRYLQGRIPGRGLAQVLQQRLGARVAGSVHPVPEAGQRPARPQVLADHPARPLRAGHRAQQLVRQDACLAMQGSVRGGKTGQHRVVGAGAA